MSLLIPAQFLECLYRRSFSSRRIVLCAYPYAVDSPSSYALKGIAYFSFVRSSFNDKQLELVRSWNEDHVQSNALYSRRTDLPSSLVVRLSSRPGGLPLVSLPSVRQLSAESGLGVLSRARSRPTDAEDALLALRSSSRLFQSTTKRPSPTATRGRWAFEKVTATSVYDRLQTTGRYGGDCDSGNDVVEPGLAQEQRPIQQDQIAKASSSSCPDLLVGNISYENP